MSLNRIRRLNIAVTELKQETTELKKQLKAFNDDRIATEKQINEITSQMAGMTENIMHTLKVLVEGAEKKMTKQINMEVAKAMKKEAVTKPTRRKKKT